MPIDPIQSLGSLGRLRPLADAPPAAAGNPAGGFVAVLNGLLGESTRANSAADAAIAGLADGTAQDVHTVTLAVAQADLSFRLILELRNRLAEAFQEVTRMQV